MAYGQAGISSAAAKRIGSAANSGSGSSGGWHAPWRGISAHETSGRLKRHVGGTWRAMAGSRRNGISGGISVAAAWRNGVAIIMAARQQAMA